ncbi:MAG TPA: hypothetical protein VKV28_13390 [Candidatus Binataceae bacterium]|nr:hypothetical protein [Candidatus Binataceae bacterium]
MLTRSESFSPSFPVAYCASCTREVIACVVLVDGREVRQCAHCDRPLQDDLRWVGAEAVADLGYEIRPAPRGGGCGCSSGGCATCPRQ